MCWQLDVQGQMGCTLSKQINVLQAGGGQDAELWTRLHLGFGIINRDFSTYNPNDQAACEFEARGSDLLEMMVAHGMCLPFLGCPLLLLLLLHRADTN